MYPHSESQCRLRCQLEEAEQGLLQLKTNFGKALGDMLDTDEALGVMRVHKQKARSKASKARSKCYT